MEPGKPSAAKKSRKETKARVSTVEATVMDEQIWKEFPEDLRECVIARLPITTFMRFRLVCRKWNSLPKSPSFLQHWAEAVPQKQPLFFAAIRHEYVYIGALYDPFLKKWHHSTYVPPSRGLFSKSTSVGGLVCYADYSRASFRVGNHLTHNWKELPWSANSKSSFSHHRVVVGLVILNQDYSVLSAGGSKIVCLECEGKYEVYDSLKNNTPCPSPTIVGRLPANIKVPDAIGMNSVSIGNVVYFACEKPDGIMSYNVVSGKWEQFLVPYPSNNPNCFALAECGGRLLLTGFVKNNIADPIYVCVWELQITMLSWKEIDRMPSSWSSEFRGKVACYSLMNNRRLLVISIWITSRVNRIFTYDVVNREWSKVPPYIPPGHIESQKISSGIGFFPCLSASP